MKITDGRVVDPRLRGQHEQPFLSLLWESEPIETEPEQVIGSFEKVVRLRTFGSFYELVSLTDPAEPVEFSVGKLNVLGILPVPVVPVVVSTPDAEEPRLMFVGVHRVGRILRKWVGQRYIFSIDEHAAQRSEIMWQLRENPLWCLDRRVYPGQGSMRCGELAVTELDLGACRWPVCAEHKAARDSRAAARRTAVKS